MKLKLNGLLIIFMGVAAVCVALCVPTLDNAFKIVLYVVAGVFAVGGWAMLKKEDEKLDKRIEEREKEREKQLEEEAEPAKYAKKAHVLSANEKTLYDFLLSVLGESFEILPQIALVSLVDKLNYNSYRNELFRIVDFVVTDALFKPLLVIELNDSSHKRGDRIERDKKVAAILEKADLPLLTVELSELSDGNLNELKKKIYRAMRKYA